jgi:hypothetical protein
MIQTIIEVQKPGKSQKLSFDRLRESDPDYYVKLQFVRPYVSYRFIPMSTHSIIDVTTEWTKEEIIQLRDKLTEIIEIMG